MRQPVHSLLFLCLLFVLSCLAQTTHNNNWAIIISTSKYFFNYRHNSNALTVYKMVKELGIPDSQILLMLPEDVACTPRNPFPATVFNNPTHSENLYAADSIEVDYKGEEVTVEAFLRLLAGRHDSSVPLSRHLLSDENSNVFIYMSGHGGDGFIKFRDAEVLSSEDVAGAIKDMFAQRRYKNLFFLLDTCQAATLLETVDSPGVITISASARGENSYSHGTDPTVGVSLVDKMTNALVRFYQQTGGQGTFKTLLSYLSYREMGANAVVHTTKDSLSLDTTPVAAFISGANRYYPAQPNMQSPRVLENTTSDGGDVNNHAQGMNIGSLASLMDLDVDDLSVKQNMEEDDAMKKLLANFHSVVTGASGTSASGGSNDAFVQANGSISVDSDAEKREYGYIWRISVFCVAALVAVVSLVVEVRGKSSPEKGVLNRNSVNNNNMDVRRESRDIVGKNEDISDAVRQSEGSNVT